ncbi:hypothetical protein BDQ12DRAFT_692080 [Crucibulum laeve]|uniref:Uncharacterized protein n=1 Tax=Crucibulum laeve TaxID=68775 RepID=A0A5C3LIS6_9AGAR|nr:hypothetical protein BDQ12DRAFT_692080 [Crucibulum laeve]
MPRHFCLISFIELSSSSAFITRPPFIVTLAIYIHRLFSSPRARPTLHCSSRRTVIVANTKVVSHEYYSRYFKLANSTPSNHAFQSQHRCSWGDKN